MAAVSKLFENEVFSTFAFYSSVLILKMFFLGSLTAFYRITKGVYPTEEDVKFMGSKDRKGEKKKPIYDDPVVERVRRNHLNDLENIPAFIFLGCFYVATNPALSTALWHFRIYAASRLLHTVVYQSGIQPWRAILHVVGLGIMSSMAIQILMKTF